MLSDKIYIPKYGWRVHFFYAVTCYHIDEIMDCLDKLECPDDFKRRAYENMSSCRLDTGITYSNSKLKESVVVIGLTSSKEEFFNSFCHEKRHLEDHIAQTFGMQISGEEIAYLSGNISGYLFESISPFLCQCECCKNKSGHGNKSRYTHS